MEHIIAFFQRVGADPIANIYWYLIGFVLGIIGGSTIERTKWKTKLAYGLDCPFCGEPLTQCQHLRQEYKKHKDIWIDKVIYWVLREIFGREKKDLE